MFLKIEILLLSSFLEVKNEIVVVLIAVRMRWISITFAFESDVRRMSYWDKIIATRIPSIAQSTAIDDVIARDTFAFTRISQRCPK